MVVFRLLSRLFERAIQSRPTRYRNGTTAKLPCLPIPIDLRKHEARPQCSMLSRAQKMLLLLLLFFRPLRFESESIAPPMGAPAFYGL